MKCSTCGKIYKNTNSLERHLTSFYYHEATEEASALLNSVKRRRKSVVRVFKKSIRPIQPKKVITNEIGTQVDLTLLLENTDIPIVHEPVPVTQISSVQTEPVYDVMQDWCGQTYLNQDYYIPSMVNQSQDTRDEQNLLSVPVEIQTDPIEMYSSRIDINLQTDLNHLQSSLQSASDHFAFEFESAGTQTDFDIDQLIKIE